MRCKGAATNTAALFCTFAGSGDVYKRQVTVCLFPQGQGNIAQLVGYLHLAGPHQAADRHIALGVFNRHALCLHGAKLCTAQGKRCIQLPGLQLIRIQAAKGKVCLYAFGFQCTNCLLYTSGRVCGKRRYGHVDYCLHCYFLTVLSQSQFSPARWQATIRPSHSRSSGTSVRQRSVA